YVAGGGSNYDTYEVTDATGTVWVFWGGSASHTADGQLWKKTDPAGRTAYVGHKTTHATAVADYNADGTPKKIYQEYGTAGDVRRYTFTYSSSIGGLARLLEVKAETKTGGSWTTTPTGVVEVGRVSYDYYTADTSTSGDANDSHGDVADLKTVKIRTPLSDSGTDLGSGVYDERTKYYRYYKDAYSGSDDDLLGHPHTIKLILGFEGTRRYDWPGDSTFDDDFASTSIGTGALTPYADAFFTYESNNTTQRIATAFFNGECSCSGGSGAGIYKFTTATNGSYTGSGDYDTRWKTRTVVEQPDGSFQTRYFDILGQPLSSVLSDGNPTGSPNHWITAIERDGANRVTTIHSPANVTGYTHGTGAITTSTSAGLVTYLDRYASGEPSHDSELDGMVSGSRFRNGTSDSDTYTSKSILGKRSITVGGSTVVRPLVSESRAFHTASSGYTTSSTYNATTYSYAWWDTTTNTNQLYIALKSVTTTLPAVALANNGANTTHDAATYLRKDGRAAFSIAPDGIYTAMKYNNLGLPLRTVRDANPNTSGDFDTNYGPGDFGLSTSSNGGLTYASEATYDAVGRTVTATAHAGTAPRVSYMYYSRLADRRMATISSPLFVSGTPSWAGPFSYSVSNQGGRGEFSATLGTASAVTTALASWIDETDADPIDALHSTLEGTSRANVMNVSTTIYDTAGVKVVESRKYTDLITSGAWAGTSPTNYDKTEYTYDNMGRTVRVKDATATIDRTVYDALGRPIAAWTGTEDTNWTSSGNGSGDDMTQVSARSYDNAAIGAIAVGNGLVTTSASYVSGDASTGVGTSGTARTATMYYDVRGNLIATRNPQAPHTVSAYDVMRRVTATAIYSATGGVDATVNPLTDDTLASGATIRLGASETFYDERGRVYKSTSYKVSQSTGADSDSLDSLTWYDSVGRAIKTGGTSLTKTYYDRLGRPTHRFTLARTNDTTYAEADDLDDDIVLQEDHTVYDDADKTGLVMMTGTILRNYDYLTAGALDSNADGNRYAYDLTGTPDVKGRIQITAMWYDTLDRPVDTVAYGNNGGSTDFNRRPSGWLSAPARSGSSTALRTTTTYDNWGRVDAVEQPRIRTGTTGYSTKYLYDHASRKRAEIRNHTGAGAANDYTTAVTPALRDNDVYTRYTYSAGRMSTMWVDVNGDNVIDTDWSNLNNHDQVTEYFYGVDKTGTGAPTPPASTIASNRLLVQAKYPAQTNSKSTSQQSEYFAYNAQGQTTARTDQNGTEMIYEYDTGGRQTAQIADVLGTNIDVSPSGSDIDGAVRAIVTAYDSRGMVSTASQTSDTSKSAIVDQVKNTYDEWGNLITFQQDYNGAVAGSSGDDLGVEYTIAKASESSPTSGHKRRSGLRVTEVKLQRSAGATTVQHTKHQFTSASGAEWDDDAGRVSNVTNSTGSVWYVIYRYGGVAMTVRSYLGEPAITDVLADGGTSGWDVGYDRYMRQTRSLWKNGASSAVYYDSRPAYDDNSNITKVENAWITPFSAVYAPDALNRLEKATVGTLASGAIADSATLRQEDWTDKAAAKLSQTGNWTAFLAYRDNPSTAAEEQDQTRTFLGRNEPNAVTDAVSGNPDPQYLVAHSGLVTRDDTTTSSKYGYRYTYDAWGRLVKAADQDSNATIAEYRYNGLGHRIGWKAQFNLGLSYANNLWRYFQYNERWQQVGMYLETSAGANTVAANATETFLYNTSGLDGRSGSSYIDKVVFRDRDTDADGGRDERRYYLQNWRSDVVALITTTGAWVERYRYDAYGRPESYSVADIAGSGGGGGGPNGQVTSTDAAAYSAT
ncbi:MAG: hypothetical protein Q8L55_11750, partial [Phycisphaerales bacterium]|nr:hypothetical protein [Phycisphaerales bacterium]